MHILFNAAKIPEMIASNLQGYSWSFSHFFLWRAFRLQLDCGEGSAIRLDDHVFRAEVLAISHGHADHCRGLIGLLDARAGLMGANDKALTILYPKQSSSMADWIQEAESFAARRGMASIAFRAMDDGDSFELRNGRVLTAKAVEHQQGQQCMAYRVGRIRRGLKAEYAKLGAAEISKLVRQEPRGTLEEEVFECELAYSGDTLRPAPDFFAKAHVLIHEASFVMPGEADPSKGLHSDVQSVMAAARDAGVRNLVLFHMSKRYESQSSMDDVRSVIEQSGFQGPVMLIRGGYNLPTD